MGDRAMPDTVTEAFAQLRSDIDALLRQREASFRHSLRGVCTSLHEPSSATGALRPREHIEVMNKADSSRDVFVSEGSASREGSVLQATAPQMLVAADLGTLEALEHQYNLADEVDSQFSIPLDHWSKSLVNTPTSRVTTKLRNSGRTVHSCHHSLVRKLPRLVSTDSRLHYYVKSGPYELIRTIVLIIDACLVITELWHASTTARDVGYQGGIPDVPAHLILTDVCCLVMLGDLLLMWSLEFPHVDFITGRTHRRWFNILVIAEQILQVISQHAYPGERSMSTFRIVVSQLSVVRLIRAVAEVPDIAFRLELGIQEFRIMINSLMTSAMPFVMCAGPFMVILIALGVFLEEGALAFLVNHDARSYEALAQFFGTLDVTVLSLYKGLFGGMDWGLLYDALEPLPWYLRFSFLLFICFNFIAVFNIVAAAFIKVAFNRSESDSELLIQKEKRSRKVYMETMDKVFSRLDDGDGKISFSELEQHLLSPDIAAYFSILGIDTREVGKLVRLLDEDKSADINKEEFIFGCMHLKGDAKSLDLAILQREVKAMGRKITDMHRRMHRRSQFQVDIDQLAAAASAAASPMFSFV